MIINYLVINKDIATSELGMSPITRYTGEYEGDDELLACDRLIETLKGMGLKEDQNFYKGTLYVDRDSDVSFRVDSINAMEDIMWNIKLPRLAKYYRKK